MSLFDKRVIYDTPKEVRTSIFSLMGTNVKLFTMSFICAECKRIVPSIVLKEVESFLLDKSLSPSSFSNAYAALYFFYERYCEELGVPKSIKRIILEKSIT